MPVYSAPGVYFEPLDTGAQRIDVLRTDIAGFVGVSRRGPLHTPVRIASWEQFQSAFGTLIGNALLPWAAKAFFENGGRTCRVVRVAAPAVATTTTGVQPVDRLSSIVVSSAGFAAGAAATLSQTTDTQTSAAPQPADRHSSIVNSVAGFTQGAAVRVTQGGQPATFLRVAAVEAPASRLYWSGTLHAAYNLALPISLRVVQQSNRLIDRITGATIHWTRAIDAAYDLARPIDVATGASPATGDFVDDTATPALRVEASSPGAWGNEVSVIAARTSLHATRTTGAQPADRASSFVESVTGLAPGSVIKVFQDGVPVDHRIVSAVDPARRRLIWSAPLDAALNLAQPIAFESVEFTLSVYEGAQIRESFDGLRVATAAAIVNARSRLIRVTDLASPAPPPGSFPDPNSPALDRGRLRLRGGRDGIAALRPVDFTGSFLTDERNGLRAFELIDEVSMIAIPDVLIEPVPPVEHAPPPDPEPPDPCLLDPPLAPPVIAPPPAPAIEESSATFTEDQIFSVQSAMIDHCERLRDRVALIDPPDYRAADLGEIESWRRLFDTKYAALYFPWVVVYDPLARRGRLTRAIPPSGHVAGVWARSDLAIGVHKAPANEELRWAQDATLEITAPMQEILNPIGINAIRSLSARGLRVYGARTVSSDAQWRYVNVRRLLIMIEEALDQALQWAVFEPNDAVLREKIALSISSFLDQLWGRGALKGVSREEAYFVKCSEVNNSPDMAANGQLLAEVGVAPAIPAEFVVFRIGRTEDVLEIRESEGGG